MALLTSCDRDHITRKAGNIYHVASHRKSLLISVLQGQETKILLFCCSAIFNMVSPHALRWLLKLQPLCLHSSQCKREQRVHFLPLRELPRITFFISALSGQKLVSSPRLAVKTLFQEAMSPAKKVRFHY